MEKWELVEFRGVQWLFVQYLIIVCNVLDWVKGQKYFTEMEIYLFSSMAEISVTLSSIT
jgi:hypothetical protein